MGESQQEQLAVAFDARVRLEFVGSKITSDAGLLAYRELDERLGLTEMAHGFLTEQRTGCNIQHQLVPLVRQSVYSRLAVQLTTEAPSLIWVIPGILPHRRWPESGLYSSEGGVGRMQDDEVARCWDENAEVWARHVRAGYDTYRDLYNNPAFFDFVGDLSGQLVLDAGCGEGHNTRLLAQQGAKMVGIDIAPRMIELAREEEERAPLGIRYGVASVSDLAVLADETFDAVVSTMALMDCADHERAVREFWRVLRPGAC